MTVIGIPKISVIVPVYNVEQYLPRCIDSILAQTFTDFELLLIDDGSTDNSSAICDEYARRDSRVSVFHKKNGGVSSARNVGICEAKGEFACFVDSDDWLEPDCYSSLLGDESIADLTYFGCCWQFSDGSSTSYRPSPFYASERKALEEQLAYLKNNQQGFEYLGFTWNKLFRKSIIDSFQVRFAQGLTLREDELFTLSYATHAASLRVKPEVLYNYRVVPTGLTHASKSVGEYLSLARQLNVVMSCYSSDALLRQEYNAILSYVFSAVSNEKILSKRWFGIIRYFIKFGRVVKRKYGLTSFGVSLLFRYDCVVYQYAASAVIGFMCKLKNKH